ncbi:class I SAM-dependent methyltransferase [Colwellia sp. 75C3]|uniref:class I SAM-dependent methyltransferase n=1 Tax=Colwellia sp. 75C3 TaxID=888425 RepID=UPI000C32D32A|nr:class I SAM-dependent methyltransferase [Colwellia sp. 75C3]PKG81121.1 class I SAM-dependent methyltransferase [Colwellia sp. 75C3]
MKKSVKELHAIRAKMWDASISRHEHYIDKSTGLFSTKFTEERSCPVCTNNTPAFMFNKEGGTYVKCSSCNMVYLNPVFIDEELTKFYQSNHSVQSEIVETDEDDFYSTIYNQGLDSVLSKAQLLTSILDIGCSSGAFLDLAAKRGLKTIGIELNESEFRLAEQKGHETYNDSLENIDFKQEIDIVCMWDVFEHIKDGEVCLNTIKSILSINGLIFLQIPSSDALAAKMLGAKCNMYDGIEHVNLYGIETIKKIANKCGLEIASMKTVISEISVMNNYLNYDDPYMGDTKNQSSVHGIIDEKSIHENLLGYKLQVILRR